MNVNATPPQNRRPLVLVTVLFFAPLLVAFLLYYLGAWRPSRSTNRGDLIHPARSLPAIALHDDAGKELPAEFLQHSWSLVYIGDGQCDARCKTALADMQRARELLGKDMSRVQSVFLASDHCCVGEFLHSIYPKLIVARVDEQNSASLVALFPLYGNVPLSIAGRIYIVDPLGNLMMSYAPDAPSLGIYEDLKTLLNLSHIG
ncbi:MAG TPA: SCO family protein [Steroidobacteraceae bacterium]|nr:SCO family protein [Steroidobacteraceae bacterium]